MTGAVASQTVTEARNGPLRMVGTHPRRVSAEGGLTVRQTRRTETKVGASDPAVAGGRAVAKRIKATLGITG